MKRIKLTQGKYALVDDADFEWLSSFKWYPLGRLKKYVYKHSHGRNGKIILLHRLIMDCPQGKEVDHKDNNGFNNQRKNLRICTSSENQCNRGKTKSNTSGSVGIRWHKSDKKWEAFIGKDKKWIHLGNFKTKEEAVRARKKAEIKYHGKFRRIT